MTNLLDKELKNLMRGQAVNAGAFVWASNDNTGTELAHAHTVLRLDPSDPDIDQILSFAQTLLVAYGYKLDGLSGVPVGEAPDNFDVAVYTEQSVGALRRNTQLIHLLLLRGLIEAFNHAKSDRARLAVILQTLAQ